jgi:hypothetical protein
MIQEETVWRTANSFPLNDKFAGGSCGIPPQFSFKLQRNFAPYCFLKTSSQAKGHKKRAAGKFLPLFFRDRSGPPA